MRKATPPNCRAPQPRCYGHVNSVTPQELHVPLQSAQTSRIHPRDNCTRLPHDLLPAGLPNMSAKLVSPPSKESRLEEKGSKIVRMEEPLWEYMPSAYICVLEGRLLANGDLKARVISNVV